MKNSLCFLLLFLCITAYTQVQTDVSGDAAVPDSLTETRDPRYILGVGFNIVDNTSTRNNQFLNWSEHYNFGPFISKISLERKFNPYFATEAAITYNKIRKGKFQNGEITLGEDVNYYALDLLGKLYVSQFFMKDSWLDIDILAGLGLHTAKNVFNQSIAYGIGFQAWVFPRFGLRLQTMGKSAFNQKTLANNHIQHSAEVLFRF